MTVLNLSSNSKAYVFDEIQPIITAIYRIEGPHHQFLIDTYCGAGYLDEVLHDISSCSKPLIVINTHHHWDHIWGNCVFQENPIIAHSLCQKECASTWEECLKEYHQYAKGNCTKTLPSLTFDQHLVFEKDGIELMYTPGHTMDSISIYDRTQRILYAGDNLELPLVYITHPDLDLYINTLNWYLELDALRYTGNHTLTVTKADIQQIVQYLENLKNGIPMQFDESYLQEVHEGNLKILAEKKV